MGRSIGHGSLAARVCRGLGAPVYASWMVILRRAMSINAVKGVEMVLVRRGRQNSAPREEICAACFSATTPGEFRRYQSGHELTVRVQTDLEHPHPGSQRESCRRGRRGPHQGSPRSLCRHSRDADCRGHARPGVDGSCLAPPCPMRRCGCAKPAAARCSRFLSGCSFVTPVPARC